MSQRTEPSQTYYHGRRGPAVFIEGQPAFFTSDREGASWYAHERGSWDDAPQVYTAIVDVRRPAEFADLQAAVSAVGATEEDVARQSPYEGDNILDFLYVPVVRQALEERGFDGYAGWDVLTNSEIPVLVAFHPAQISGLATIPEDDSSGEQERSVDLYGLRPGDRIQTIDGDVVEIAAPTQDGEWIQVRYVEAHDPALVGTLDLCHVHELEATISTT